MLTGCVPLFLCIIASLPVPQPHQPHPSSPKKGLKKDYIPGYLPISPLLCHQKGTSLLPLPQAQSNLRRIEYRYM
ncbi:hypothetical protein F5B20DRAFT_520179 [Whalleya microplaca]|nr:hypothetical protein F5B20DRAFT_520179 [Whalleya microplaca]